MAPSLPSYISSTFSSHKQASWFVLVTLAPILLPFLFLSVPFLLLFLAPLSCFLLFLFFLYKVQVSVRCKRLCFLGRADKGALNKGCQSTLPNVVAQEHWEDREERKFRASPEVSPEFEELQTSQIAAVPTAYEVGDEGAIPASLSDSEGQKQKQKLTEVLPTHDGTTEFEELQDSYVQDAEISTAYEAQGETVLPSSVSDSEQKKQEHTEAPLTHDGTTEGETEEKREERIHGGFLEYARPLHSFVPVVEPPPPYKTPVEVESSENIMAYDTQKHLPLFEEGTSSHTDISTLLPSAYEHGECSPEASYTFHDQTSVRSEHEQGKEALGGKEGLVGPHDVPDQLIEEPWKVASGEGFEFGTEEHLRQEPELSCDKEPSLEHLDFATRQEDERSSFEPFEKGIQADEPSPEGIAEQRKEAFAKERPGDVQSQKDRSAKESVESFEAQWPEVGPCETSSAVAKEGFAKEVQGDAESQKDRPVKESLEAQWPVETEEGSSAAAMPSNMQAQGGIEFQDNIQEEQRILADINAIKKIVGYQGDPNAPIMEQIRAMYMFLGMEPYYWATEVEYFERARAEIELLKMGQITSGCKLPADRSQVLFPALKDPFFKAQKFGVHLGLLCIIATLVLLFY